MHTPHHHHQPPPAAPQWWQFLIWVRQLLLTFTTIMPEFLSSRLVAATVRADLR